MIASLRLNGLELNSYAKEHLFQNQTLLHNIVNLLKIFVSIFIYGTYGIISTTVSKVVHIFIIAIFGASLILFAYKNKTKSLNFIAYLCCIGVLFPLAVNCVSIMNPGNSHTIMLMSFIVFYVSIISILDSLSIKVDIKSQKDAFVKHIKTVSLLCLSIIILSNIFLANRAYLQLKLQTDGDRVFYSNIVSHIQDTVGFDENSKIAVIGQVDRNDNLPKKFGVEKLIGFGRYSGRGEYFAKNYLTNFISVDLDFATEEEIREIKETSAFSEMPSYPYNGYVKKIGNFIVVKLGDVKEAN